MAKFKFEPIAKFWNKVTVTRPDGEQQEFEAEFIYLDDEAWKKSEGMANVDFLRTNWTGWRGIVAGDPETEISWSEAQRELFLGHAYIANAVMGAYTVARQGLRTKN